MKLSTQMINKNSSPLQIYFILRLFDLNHISSLKIQLSSYLIFFFAQQLIIMKARSQKASLNHPKEQNKKTREFFDQEDQNFDMLELGENNDREYQSMLKSQQPKKINKNNYFLQNQRYHGVTQPTDDKEEQEASKSEEEVQVNSISNALKEMKNQKKQKSKLLQENIKQIQQEDEEFEHLRKMKKSSLQNLEEAVDLKNQMNLYKELVDIRYNQQNQLENIKKYPKRNFPLHEELNHKNKILEKDLIENISLIQEAFHQYGKKTYQLSEESAETNLTEKIEKQIEDGASYNHSKLNVEKIYENFLLESKDLTKEIEKQLIKWSQKTTLLNRTTSSSQYSSLIMQTPVGQAKKIASNWERVSGKSQNKRSAFKILFEEDQNVKFPNDDQIYDDFDLFNEIQKVYVNEVEEDNEFRVSDTMKYLKNREGHEAKHKDVDRKASKNRKIRFNVHAKLLNFMPSQVANLMESRDDIVRNMFNCKALEQKLNEPENDTYYIDM